MLKSNTITQTDKYLITIGIFFFLPFFHDVVLIASTDTGDRVRHKSLTVSLRSVINNYKWIYIEEFYLFWLNFYSLASRFIDLKEWHTFFMGRREARWGWVRNPFELSHWRTGMVPHIEKKMHIQTWENDDLLYMVENGDSEELRD